MLLCVNNQYLIPSSVFGCFCVRSVAIYLSFSHRIQDDSELVEEQMRRDEGMAVATKHDGFFVNAGSLETKRKKKRVALSSSSSSSSSGSNSRQRQKAATTTTTAAAAAAAKTSMATT